jgi:SAM-dependent methyltransferase
VGRRPVPEQWVRRLGRIVVDTRHWYGLRRLRRRHRHEYANYLNIQLRRTLSKRREATGRGARLLVEHVAGAVEPASAVVLCVGCRNGAELDEFRRHGFPRVVGIDLFSQRSDILVMDMHEMTFPDDAFDVVYATHSLEHAFDIGRVVAEIVRVARDGAIVAVEVPVRVRASLADRIEFSGVGELGRAFAAHVGDELWSEEQPPRTASNEHGTDVARLVFRLRKSLAPPRGTAGDGALGRVPGRDPCER